MRWVVIFLAGVVLVALLWTFGFQPGLNRPTTEHTPGGFTQQTVGESKSGQSQDMPAREASDRSGTAEFGYRAQSISQTGTGEMPVAPDQRQQISEYFRAKAATRSDDKFGIAVGASVPRQVQLAPLPPEIAELTGKYRGDEYVLVNDHLIVVEPKVRRIVAIIPLN
jgi:hypothetical protein